MNKRKKKKIMKRKMNPKIQNQKPMKCQDNEEFLEFLNRSKMLLRIQDWIFEEDDDPEYEERKGKKTLKSCFESKDLEQKGNVVIQYFISELFNEHTIALIISHPHLFLNQSD